MKPIYPEVKIETEGQNCKFTTHLRMQDDHGTWYLKKISMEFYSVSNTPENREEERMNLLNRFHKQVYKQRYTSRVDLGLVDADENPVFVEDVEQLSEEDRVRMLYTMQGFAGK